jgi:fumarate reductase subunit C
MSRNPYVRPVSKTTWYMRSGRYKKYMLREVTCLLVGFYSFFTICALGILAGGSAEAWESFLAAQQNGFWIAFHAIALIFFLVYMTFDWFKLAPKAMPVQLGEQKLPDLYIILAHYVAWVAVTAVVFWLAGVI